MNSNEPRRALPAEALAKAGPGDVFRHLLAIVTLYLAAISFGMVTFALIDRWFPDPLSYPMGVNAGPLRWALSALVIVFPVYVWISWVNARAALHDPSLRALRIRRWLYHFTVFAASVVIIGDLVALVYNFLNGDLTGRFLLKFLTVFFIAAVVFAYYIWNIRREAMASADSRMRWLVFGTVAIVAIAAVSGFVVAGSPFAERMRRFDDRRVNDLQTIQWQVINYWQRKDRLPDNVDQLRDDISGFVSPTDPETGQVYGYQPLGNLKFELCATFSREARTNGDSRVPSIAFPGPKMPESWAHGAGRMCFGRTIDPDLYGIEKLAPVR